MRRTVGHRDHAARAGSTGPRGFSLVEPAELHLVVGINEKLPDNSWVA